MHDREVKRILTVNSPVTASKPTWMVCSKSEGRDISGRSFSFFLFAAGGEQKLMPLPRVILLHSKLGKLGASGARWEREGDLRREMLTLVSPGEDGAQADFLVLLFGSHWKRFGGVIQQGRVSGTTIHSQGGGRWFLFNINTIRHL